MKRMPFIRPTTYYDEKIKEIDEQICKLIKQRREISDSNPGYPPIEYITDWAERYELYKDQLFAIFNMLWDEKMFIPTVEPEGFQKNLPLCKAIEVNDKLYSVISIRQYSNCSIINFNIDWDTSDYLPDYQRPHTHYELSIDDHYRCSIMNGSGGDGHFHYNYIVSPALPDNTLGLELLIKEYEVPLNNSKQIGSDIVLRL